MLKKCFINAFSLAFSLLLLMPVSGVSETATETAPGRELARQAVKSKKLWITADHSKFDALKQKFNSGPEVTKACISCHTEAALQFHKTIHWTWLDPRTKDTAMLGKGGLSINNFCINAKSNEARCTSCHAGYGWKGKGFDFTDQTKVDCLVCHESTGTYKKFPTAAGNPVSQPKVFPENKKMFYPPEWNKVAQSVQRPTRNNCGTCHFFGGGGDAVKHGDLDSSLFNPDKNLDVHMGKDGQNFKCTRCHSTTLHNIAGRVYTTPAVKTVKSLLEDDLASKITCVSCHGKTPHKEHAKANDHTDIVACQSCHIPEYARINPTKMRWDWSTAGKKKDGKPFKIKGPLGKPSYDSKKGDFVWKKNVKPDYFWYNGSIEHLSVKDVIDPSKVIAISKPSGKKGEANTLIYPFKVHTGKIPYDKVNKKFVIPHLFPRDKNDKEAYWKHFDWGKAIKAGQDFVNLPFSGEYDFVETTYVFPTTHMVAPKNKVVKCSECHTRVGSRLSSITNVYMPGRDKNRVTDTIGWFLVIVALFGVTLHGLGRVFIRKNGGESHE